MPAQDLKPEKRRLADFSDAFIAVVLVVMAADLRDTLPNDPTSLAAWAPEARSLLAFLLGFFTLAVVWVNHAFLTGALDQANRATLWLNLNVMFWISLFPVTVRLLGRGDSLQGGAIAYGLVLTAMAASIYVLRAYSRARSRSNRAMDALSETSNYRSAAAMLICAGSVPLAFVSPYVSIACFVVAPALFLIPEARPARR
jgi:uncharacterized membrane protein